LLLPLLILSVAGAEAALGTSFLLATCTECTAAATVAATIQPAYFESKAKVSSLQQLGISPVKNERGDCMFVSGAEIPRVPAPDIMKVDRVHATELQVFETKMTDFIQVEVRLEKKSWIGMLQLLDEQKNGNGMGMRINGSAVVGHDYQWNAGLESASSKQACNVKASVSVSADDQAKLASPALAICPCRHQKLEKNRNMEKRTKNDASSQSMQSLFMTCSAALIFLPLRPEAAEMCRLGDNASYSSKQIFSDLERGNEKLEEYVFSECVHNKTGLIWSSSEENICNETANTIALSSLIVLVILVVVAAASFVIQMREQLVGTLHHLGSSCFLRAMRLGDVTASAWSYSGSPPGCSRGCYWRFDNSLWYNTLSTSTRSCSSNSDFCLCVAAPDCAQTNGATSNTAPCLCGGGLCTAASGLVCNSTASQCGKLCVSGWNEGCFDPSTESCSIRDMSSCSAAELITIKTLYNNREQC